MHRCTSRPPRHGRALALAAALALLAPAAAHAQMQRPFPPTALRGVIVVVQPPEISLNGRPMRLAPGARIRDRNNMLAMSGPLIGEKLTVHYTIDIDGNVRDVWILTADELAKRPWPTTPEEAARWTFDPATQTWTR